MPYRQYRKLELIYHGFQNNKGIKIKRVYLFCARFSVTLNNLLSTRHKKQTLRSFFRNFE